MKRSYLIGAFLVLAFAALGVTQLRSTLTTYVGFSEARASDSAVQIKGEIDRKSVRHDEKTGSLHFDVTDESGQKMKIVYSGSTPGNFAQASHVVAIGRYSGGAFNASDLLVKCPSKYQGQTYQPTK